jgi:apolipoprotein N-acyltransferase
MHRRTAIFAAFLSGLGIFLALSHRAYFLVWIALVPFFLVIDKHPKSRSLPGAHKPFKSRFLPGLVLGATLSAFSFAWMIPGTHAFTGAASGYGFAIFLLCGTAFSFGCAALAWLTPPLLVAPVWVLAETALQWAAGKMPWFLLHIGNALAADLYAIQPVSVIGVTGAAFIVIMVNYLLARALRDRNRKFVWASMILVAGYMSWGWWLLPPETKNDASFSLAILTENIPPEIPWDQFTGNQRVRELLRQEDRCLDARPQMILWSESAIPWTYSPDDDLVREVLRHSATLPVTHILGMNTAVSAKVVRNSAWCLLPDGKVAARYDKVDPLLFIEQPWLGWQFPFFSSDGYSVQPGDRDQPIVTPEGKAGVLICNESTLPRAAASRVRQGAQFLLNLSNDGWFRDTWLVDQHFYNARLRAVETRKDIAVNSNNGWSGCIHASGRIDTAGPLFRIQPNDKRPIAVHYPLLPVYGSLLFLIIAIVNQKTRFL